MATTTNYGWETPDDTDLVKDGAAAIRTLGSSIDTTTKNLNPETTLGDISYRSSTANTNTRLAIGTTGQILTVNGGVPSWATPAAAGGMTQLATGTLSGTTGTNLTSISGSYKDLILVVRGFDPATDNAFNFRINNDSTANRYHKDTNNSLSNQNYASSIISGAFNLDSVVNQNLIIVTFYDYANTSTWKWGEFNYVGNNGTTTANFDSEFSRWYYNQTGAITQLNLAILGGGVSGGTYVLYGVN